MDKLEPAEAREMFVVKSNTIIQKSRFSLSLIEQRILLYIISKIQPNDTDFKEYEFNIADFCRCIGIETQSGANYRDIKKAIKSIRDKSLWLDLDNGTTSLVSWIEKARINEGSGTIQVRLDSDLKPFLLQLKEHYTQYQLYYTLRMKSRYSLRLYEIIVSFFYSKLGTYSKTFSVEELKTLLDATKYVKFFSFHKDVLKISVSEINNLTDINLSYKQIKQGRKTIAIEFTFSTKEVIERLRIADETDKELGIDKQKTF